MRPKIPLLEFHLIILGRSPDLPPPPQGGVRTWPTGIWSQSANSRIDTVGWGQSSQLNSYYCVFTFSKVISQLLQRLNTYVTRVMFNIFIHLMYIYEIHEKIKKSLVTF